MVELAGEVADGAFLFVGLDSKSIACARQHLEVGALKAGRSLAQFKTVFISTISVEEGQGEAVRWVRSWFAPNQPWLCYPSASNLYWLRAAGIDLGPNLNPELISQEHAERIADAFGLFGSAERCLDRLRRAQEESDVDHVFLFPAHTLERGYELPAHVVDAFARVIGTGL
jgi:alkanesulfonate monooxygenase SsuD/methylene tetrahydromethanopterin reductase-like flavin-dependent oxidoreductase (luciferase family)